MKFAYYIDCEPDISVFWKAGMKRRMTLELPGLHAQQDSWHVVIDERRFRAAHPITLR
jgi:hypothetical protein